MEFNKESYNVWQINCVKNAQMKEKRKSVAKNNNMHTV